MERRLSMRACMQSLSRRHLVRSSRVCWQDDDMSSGALKFPESPWDVVLAPNKLPTDSHVSTEVYPSCLPHGEGRMPWSGNGLFFKLRTITL